MHRSLFYPAVPLFLASLASAQTVHTVDDGGGAGVDFIEIQDAVNGAAEGDVILVRTGNYDPVVVSGKSLTIQAEFGSMVRLVDPCNCTVSGFPMLEVRDLAAGQEVFIRGLVVGGSYFHPFGFPVEAVRVSNNNGAVWFENTRVADTNNFTIQGIVVSNSVGVTFSRCIVSQNGSWGVPPSFFGHGLEVIDSNVAMFACTVNGGESAGRQGGDAVVVDGGTFYASGSSFLGGDGGNGTGFTPDGADGGDGLRVEDGALVRLQDSTILGGAGGTAGSGGIDGVAGQSTQIVSGALVPVIGTARTLVEASPVRAGVDDFVETFTGKPGDWVYRLYATDGQIPPVYLAFEKAPLVLDLNLFGDFMGVMDASGTMISATPSAPMPVGVDGAIITTQASFLDTDGTGFYFSAPSVISLVADSF